MDTFWSTFSCCLVFEMLMVGLVWEYLSFTFEFYLWLLKIIISTMTFTFTKTYTGWLLLRWSNLMKLQVSLCMKSPSLPVKFYSVSLEQGLTKCPVNVHTLNTFCSVSHRVSVPTPQLCHGSVNIGDIETNKCCLIVFGKNTSFETKTDIRLVACLFLVESSLSCLN